MLARWPLEVLLAKAVWRYFKRVHGDMVGAQDHPVSMVAKWATSVSVEGIELVQGMRFAVEVENVGGLYRAWGATLRRGIEQCTHLPTHRAQALWHSFFELGLNGGHTKLKALKLPSRTTAETFRATIRGCHVKIAEDTSVLSALNRPSWLLGAPSVLTEFLSLTYEDTSWLGHHLILDRATLLSIDFQRLPV